MNKGELLEKLEQSRTDFLEILEPLSEEQLLQPTLAGGWSVKDSLVHLMLWEAELIKLLFQTHQGRTPKTILNGNETDDEVNARWYSQHKDRPLEQALEDFENIRNHTIYRIESFSERDLTDPKRFKWLNGKPLWIWIGASTFEHESEHIGEIHSYRP